MNRHHWFGGKLGPLVVGVAYRVSEFCRRSSPRSLAWNSSEGHDRLKDRKRYQVHAISQHGMVGEAESINPTVTNVCLGLMDGREVIFVTGRILSDGGSKHAILKPCCFSTLRAVIIHVVSTKLSLRNHICGFSREPGPSALVTC